MTFLWPELLWLLLIVPALVALYFTLLRRKKRLALRYASLGLVSRAMDTGQKLRRHIPPLVFLLALVTLIVAIARPSATLTLPSQYETIVLAIDVSGSMRASDVAPNRIGAAQEAARKFIADQPASARIGVVSFAATASVVQPPTRDRQEILAAIDRFQLQRGTAIGSGILVALKTIFPDVEFDLRASNPRGETKAVPLDSAKSKSVEQAEPGSYGSAAIILLSDGQTTTGPNPIEAAKMAAERGVRVFTVGIGTTKGEVLGSEGWSMRVKLDEEALKNIAQVTRAEYFFADNSVDLKKIYESLNTRLSMETRQTEITALLAAAAAALSLLSAFLSVLWFNRIL
ncbi:MAG TPA: VWA domain-containing protein [Casimicrobiaceae bacterium]|nr:VWA domain-containing protein [Casimicrobiaceae bacterium]